MPREQQLAAALWAIDPLYRLAHGRHPVQKTAARALVPQLSGAFWRRRSGTGAAAFTQERGGRAAGVLLLLLLTRFSDTLDFGTVFSSVWLGGLAAEV